MAFRAFSVAVLIVAYVTTQQSLAASLPKASEHSTDKANTFVTEYKEKVVQTYREKYHAMPPIGWTNDPNGFIYFQGEYHLFYQANPYNAYANKIHWGHSKSKDLVHWEDLPIALAPDEDYDIDGVFSGSAIEKNGRLYVMYTGNAGDSQVQCIAYSDDGVNFQKIPENPVLTADHLPPGAQRQDFRDPKVFQRGETYYVVLASKATNSTEQADIGQVLLYESKDLIEWKFKSVLLKGTTKQGIMWECPDLFELGGKDVLVLSPIEMPRDGNDYHNYDSVIAFIGKVNWETGTMNVETMKEIDHGMDFYATQSLLDGQDRRIQISWMNMWKRNYPTQELLHRWAGSMTLPRQLSIENNQLMQLPIYEIANIQKDPVELTSVTLSDEVKELDNVSGEVAALDLVVDLTNTDVFTLDLRANDIEKTVLSYAKSTGELTLDRSKSGIAVSGAENPQVNSRKVAVPLKGNKLKLQIFLDTSSVEVFVNDGAETFTATIYPTEMASDRIRFGAEGTAVIESLRFALIEPDPCAITPCSASSKLVSNYLVTLGVCYLLLKIFYTK